MGSFLLGDGEMRGGSAVGNGDAMEVRANGFRTMDRQDAIAERRRNLGGIDFEGQGDAALPRGLRGGFALLRGCRFVGQDDGIALERQINIRSGFAGETRFKDGGIFVHPDVDGRKTPGCTMVVGSWISTTYPNLSAFKKSVSV